MISRMRVWNNNEERQHVFVEEIYPPYKRNSLPHVRQMLSEQSSFCYYPLQRVITSEEMHLRPLDRNIGLYIA